MYVYMCGHNITILKVFKFSSYFVSICSLSGTVIVNYIINLDVLFNNNSCLQSVVQSLMMHFCRLGQNCQYV